MDLGVIDAFLLVARWVHAIAAVAWVGGSIFFAFILRPAIRIEPDALGRAMGTLSRFFREIVDLAVVAILITGIVLTFDRLTDEAATAAYGAVLGVKIALSLAMFYQVWNLRQTGGVDAPAPRFLRKASWLLGYNALVTLGVIVFFLADLLGVLFESALGAAG